MDYMFSQHDLSFLDDVIPEKDKKKKEDEKKKKKRGSMDSDAEDVRVSSYFCSSLSFVLHDSDPPVCQPHQQPPALLPTPSTC